jgi:pyruvate/2-oxoglutarate dehydrogenase complex dihydrolipoamide dehydrogenase (E3) component
LIGSVDSKWQPFSVELSFGNRKKSAGARSGEYGGCGRTVIACLAKKSRKSYIGAHCSGHNVAELIHKAATVTFNNAHIAQVVNTRCGLMKTKKREGKYLPLPSLLV